MNRQFVSRLHWRASIWRRVPRGRRATIVAGAAAGCLVATAAAAADVARGEAVAYRSPNGVEERCVILTRVPGGVYSDADSAEEKAFCAIDFYAGSHALCPKVFSTSPGTLVYDIGRGPFAGKPQAFEAEQCATSSPHKRGALGEPVSYKMTMNDAKTSATFSTASLLYYHFSRYLNADVHVPVSVHRSMDRGAHLARVTRRGFEISAHRQGGAMNHAGWQILQAAETNPKSYPASRELFAGDGALVYGILLHPHGDRYGAEVNGSRRSGWGEGQNRDFQDTAPFRALRSGKPLGDAIEDGIHAAAGDAELRQALRHGVSAPQMVFWMKELTEITLLDYVFSQQDRIGNIDYLSYWYWIESGEVRRQPASSTKVPAEIAQHHPLYLRRTQLNDNDAGGRLQYANFAKKTGMLENIRHYGADTYRRLMRLDADYAAQGVLYRYTRESFGLDDAQFRQVVSNVRAAAEILRGSCRAGKLRFDLDPQAFLVTGSATEQVLDCDRP